MSIQISGGGPSVAEIQGGLATAAALAALATSTAGREQAISVNAPNHIDVTVDLSSATWNTVGTHEVFTVTGIVRMRMWAYCAQQLAGDGDISIVDALLNRIFYVGAMSDVAGTELLSNGNDPLQIESTAYAIVDKVSYNFDIGYIVNASAATGGTLIFHCVWEPLSAGATVVAGAGGPL